jgi:Ca-activated chloride channel family protein
MRHTRRTPPWRFVVVTIVLAACTAGLQVPHAQKSSATFRSVTDLVALQVVVIDQHGRFVPDLRLEDFAVYEDGARQTPTVFASSTAPLDLMVLIDTSSSMAGRLALAQYATLSLLRALQPDDAAAVVLFSDSVRVAQPLTRDVPRLEAAVQSATLGGATALYEALYVAMHELARGRRAGGPFRRHAVVVLSDGDDNSSRAVAFDDVLDAARRTAVTIFTVLPSPFAGVPPRDAWERRLHTVFDMRSLAEETGGRAFAPDASSELAGIYRDIADELAAQYWLAYPAPTGRPGFRRVAVRMEKLPGARARTRAGYDAGGAAP